MKGTKGTKKFLSVFLTAALMFAAIAPALAAGTPTLKEEVVYGVLGPDGSVQNINVVNSFKGGRITDYGNYSAVNNMTSSEELTQEGDMITVNTTADRFYYQGTLETKTLPWDIAIKYKFNGKEISASELAGKSGTLMLTVSVTQNKTVNPAFYENYMLQLSLPLNTDMCTDIESPNATLANAGKNKLVTHTILPGKDATITVTAKVQDFTMSGIEITALPLSMLIEKPDTDSLTKDMTSLSDTVGTLNDGVKKLSEGLAKTYSGANELTDGSSDFASGLSELSRNSGEMLKASAQINTALSDIARVLEDGNKGNKDFGLSELAALPGGLNQLAAGLNRITDGMQTLKNGYASAYYALDRAVAAIPSTEIDPSGLYAAVYGDKALTATLDQLVGYYAAAQKVKGTYLAVQEAFASVEGSLDAMSGSVSTIAGTLSGTANELAQSMSEMEDEAKLQQQQMRQLTAGLAELSANYGQFQAGLAEYMSGVERLAKGYGEIDAGIKSLVGSTGELNSGADVLYEGTSELNNAAAGLPDTVQAEIDELVKQYDKSDFVPVSFVSEKNTEVTAVQFIIKTAAIKSPEMQQPAVTTPEKLTLWQKLLRLFGIYR